MFMIILDRRGNLIGKNAIAKRKLVVDNKPVNCLKGADMPRPGQHPPADKPTTDHEYFERMSRVIFMSGLNWRTLEKKWPGIRAAFADFDIDRVAEFDEPEIDRLMQNSDVIRNLPKIRAIIQNAQKFQDIIKEQGSFAKYLSQLRADGEDALRTAIAKNFAFMGHGTTVIFLFSVGEELPQATADWQARHEREAK